MDRSGFFFMSNSLSASSFCVASSSVLSLLIHYAVVYKAENQRTINISSCVFCVFFMARHWWGLLNCSKVCFSFCSSLLGGICLKEARIMNWKILFGVQMQIHISWLAILPFVHIRVEKMLKHLAFNYFWMIEKYLYDSYILGQSIFHSEYVIS